MNVHENGAKRHGANWINANQIAADVLMGSKLRINDPAVKETVPLILLRVLDRLKLQEGFNWDKEQGSWVPREAVRDAAPQAKATTQEQQDELDALMLRQEREVGQ
jgi:hypothetical protein